MSASPTPQPDGLDYKGLGVIHLFHQFNSVGGVESVLRHHYDNDLSLGLCSDLIIYLEDPAHSRERLHCLGITPNETIRQVSQRLSAVTRKLKDRVAIYHLPWGFSFFGPVDNASRRILLLHSEPPSIRGILQKHGCYLDGILCVNRELESLAKSMVPSLGPDRIITVGCPIAPPAGFRVSNVISKPIKVGFIGRLQVEQKRTDRMLPFCETLKKCGLEYHFDILGDGPERENLVQSLPSTHCTFHGVKQGADYWDRVKGLDFIVFFSDYEGTPLSLLEALSQGVIPIYPRISSGGDHYVSQVLPDLLYPVGDVSAAVGIINKLASLSPSDLSSLRERCRQAVRGHSLNTYYKTAFDFAQRIKAQPRVSKTKSTIPAKALDFLSLTQVDALAKFAGSIKSRLKG